MKNKQRVLTGDRPTGPLHLGHFVGSLQNRLVLQEEYEQFVMIADVQALTDNAAHPQKVRENVFQVMLDYLCVGIDPVKTTIFLQSMIPQIAELTVFYLNLVTVNRLRRNPTVKDEILQKGFGESVPAGFLMYPVSQAADITIMKASLVPVGQDQLPVIEQTNEIIHSFNRMYQKEVFPHVQALVPQIGGRLPGIDGAAKMGKSLGNAIYLSDSNEVLQKKVMSMYTDPGHIKVEDPGKIEGNMVFTYLDVFAQDKEQVALFKEQYQRGGLGDVKVKRYLLDCLVALLEPMQLKRKQLEQDKGYVLELLLAGTAHAEQEAARTMQEVKEVMCLLYK